MKGIEPNWIDNHIPTFCLPYWKQWKVASLNTVSVPSCKLTGKAQGLSSLLYLCNSGWLQWSKWCLCSDAITWLHQCICLDYWLPPSDFLVSDSLLQVPPQKMSDILITLWSLLCHLCYKQNLSLSFFFISFYLIFIFHLISTISQLIPISYLLFPHCLHLVSLSHYFISICLSISIPGFYPLPWFSYLYPLSIISYPLSIVSDLLSLLSLILYPLSWISYLTIYTSLLSFKSWGLSIAVYK